MKQRKSKIIQKNSVRNSKLNTNRTNNNKNNNNNNNIIIKNMNFIQKFNISHNKKITKDNKERQSEDLSLKTNRSKEKNDLKYDNFELNNMNTKKLYSTIKDPYVEYIGLL